MFSISGSIDYRINHTIEFRSLGNASLSLDYVVWTNSEPYQRVNLASQPDGLIRTLPDEHKNQISTYVAKLAAGKNNLTFSYDVTVSLSTPNVEARTAGNYDKSSELYRQYTRSEKFIESDHPKISSIAREVVGSVSDPYNASFSIFRWVNRNINYSGPHAESFGALWALQNLRGDCTEHAYLFVAMCRSIGIPARCIDGLSNSSMVRSKDFLWGNIGHDWAEVFFPSYGWIWVDPTWNWFGTNDPVHIAIQRGNSSELPSFYRFKYNGTGIRYEREIFEVNCLDTKPPDIQNMSVKPSYGSPGETFQISLEAVDPSGIRRVEVVVQFNNQLVCILLAKRIRTNTYAVNWTSSTESKAGNYRVYVTAYDNVERGMQSSLDVTITQPFPIAPALLLLILSVAALALVYRERKHHDHGCAFSVSHNGTEYV